jgi:hypothetical protein
MSMFSFVMLLNEMHSKKRTFCKLFCHINRIKISKHKEVQICDHRNMFKQEVRVFDKVRT